ncbi:hypothetical protein [Micromonospora sp. L32]|uniref:hypothetical protein n=1 Tax=Micromonospora sp. L32 TaxID=3452214 RepID=UPI003F8861E0
MSFPTDPLDVVVEIAPGANPAADPNTHSWADISDYLRVAEGSRITISRGKSSPLADTVPSQCSLVLDNSDGRFTPRNAIGAYYPSLQKNTPLRVRIRQARDLFGRTTSNGWGPADSGQVWTTSGGAAGDYSTDGAVGKHSLGSVGVLRASLIDTGLNSHRVTADVTCPVMPTGASISHWVVVRAADTSNYYAVALTVTTSGAVSLVMYRRQGGALSAPLDSASGLPVHTAGTRWRIVFELAGERLRATAWRPAVEFDPGWLVEATDTVLTAGTQVGVMSREETGNTNGTVVISWDSFDVSSIRFTGLVDRWPSRWDPSGTNRYVPITAHGVLRRIATAGEATRSPLYRYLMAQTWARTAYWPLEDGESATEASSADDQAPQMLPSAPVRFGVQAPSTSGVSTMVDPKGAYLHARMPEYYALDWRLEVVLSHGKVPSLTVRSLSWLCPGSLTRWDLNSTPTGFQIAAWTAVSGGSIQLAVNTAVIPQPGQLHHIRVDVIHPGGTDVRADVYVDGTFVGWSSATGLQAHVPNVMRINPDAVDSDNVPLVGHLIMWGERPVGSESAQAALGYPGEHAHRRIEAVCAERDVPYAPVYGAAVTSEPMGPRPSGSLVGTLRDAEATDAGLLYELRSGHVSYRRRAALVDQSAVLVLDYDEGHVAPPFEPSDDDAQLRNDVTVRRPLGSEARVVDAAHIAAVGRYETTLTLNPSDDERLEQLAAWAVRRGTVAEQRFDTIAINMSRVTASVVSQWLACDIGDRVTVDNVPTHLTPDSVDVMLAGYTEVIEWPRRWRVEMVCEPYSPWVTGVLDSTTLGRLDTAGSTLATGNTSVEVRIDAPDRAILTTAEAALFAVGNRVVLHGQDGRRKEPTVFTITSITPPAFGFQDVYLNPAPAETIRGSLSGGMDTLRRVDQTSLSVATTAGPVWTTNAAHVPFDINVGGERMTVTAVSGASSPQTFTVTRAVNGVQKHHGVGADVRLWQPLILGL